VACTGRVVTPALQAPLQEEADDESGPETREQEKRGKDKGRESHLHGRPSPLKVSASYVPDRTELFSMRGIIVGI
jgi:hypothetical protein